MAWLARLGTASSGPIGWLLAIPWYVYVIVAMAAWSLYERHGKVSEEMAFDKYKLAVAQDAITIAQGVNDENSRVVGAQGKVSNEDRQREADRLAGERRLTGTLRGLQSRLAQANTRLAASDTGVAELRATAFTYGELFGSCAAEYRDLGSEAAIARQRGLTAEGLYDALKPTAMPAR